MLRPFFSYFGSKWNIAESAYPKPIYGTIIEPFAGSASYAVRYYDRKVFLYEKNPIVASVWDYLIKVRPYEIMQLPNTVTRDPIAELQIPQEAKWLIGFWCQKGRTTPAAKGGGWCLSHSLSHELFWGPRTKKRIARQVEMIRHWVIKQADYSQASCGRASTFFVDPPYQKEGHGYTFGNRQLDYKSLAKWCRAQRGQVIVCESADAAWLPFKRAKDVRACSGKRFAEGVCVVGREPLSPEDRRLHRAVPATCPGAP